LNRIVARLGVAALSARQAREWEDPADAFTGVLAHHDAALARALIGMLTASTGVIRVRLGEAEQPRIGLVFGDDGAVVFPGDS
jgi:hypothetical protein